MTILSELILSSAAEDLDAVIHPDVDTVRIVSDFDGATLSIAGGENGTRDRETGHQDYHDRTELHGDTLQSIAEQTTEDMTGCPASIDINVHALPVITEWDTFTGEIIVDHRPHMLQEMARLLPRGGDSMRLAELSFERAARFFRYRSPKRRDDLDPVRGGMELHDARQHLNEAFYASEADSTYIGHVIAVTEPMTPEQVRALNLSEWQKNWDSLIQIAKNANQRHTEAWRSKHTAAAA